MNRTAQFLTFLLWINVTVACAQSEDQKKTMFSSSAFSEVFLFFGGATGISTAENLSEFRRMAPSSILLKEDLSDYSSYPTNEWEAHQYFGLMVGFIPGKKNRESKKYSPLIRLGISFESADYFDIYFSKSSSSRYDTLYNSQGQAVYYRDSVNLNRTYMYYNSSSLSAEASILLRTNAGKRWMFYVGAGISGGLSFKNEINVFKSDAIFVEEYEVSGTSQPYYPYSIFRDSQSEVIDIGNSWVISGFVPLGIDFRLGKKNEFLKQVHLFVELRPGIKMMGMPVVGVNSSTFTMSSLGLRYVWN